MKVRREAAQTGMDARRIWQFFSQRDGRIPQAYSTVRRARPSATQQTCPDPPPQQKLHE